MIYSLFENILANAIWAVLGAVLFAIISLLTSRLPTKRLWRFRDVTKLVIVMASSTVTDTGKYLRPATGIGQVRSLAMTVQSLQKAYGDKVNLDNLLFSTEPVQNRAHNDMVLLGGPKNNRQTQIFLDLLKDKQPAFQIENTISWKLDTLAGNEETFEGTRSSDGKAILSDYGLIIRTRNPFLQVSGSRKVVLFSGCHTYGTMAAAVYFTRMTSMWSRVFGKANMSILVKATIIDGYPIDIEMVKFHEW